MNIDRLFKSKLQEGSCKVDGDLWQKMEAKLKNHSTNAINNKVSKQSWIGKTWQSLGLSTKIATLVIPAMAVVGTVILIINREKEEIVPTDKTTQLTNKITTNKNTESNTNKAITYQKESEITNIDEKKEIQNIDFEIIDEKLQIPESQTYTPSVPKIIDNNTSTEIKHESFYADKNTQTDTNKNSTRQTSNIEVFIPNYITPNRDEINDCFIIKNIENYPDNFLIVRDRKGKKVYQQRGYKNNFCGENCHTGTYFYSLIIRQGTQKRQYNGSLEIIK